MSNVNEQAVISVVKTHFLELTNENVSGFSIFRRDENEVMYLRIWQRKRNKKTFVSRREEKKACLSKDIFKRTEAEIVVTLSYLHNNTHVTCNECSKKN
jgi:protease II